MLAASGALSNGLAGGSFTKAEPGASWPPPEEQPAEEPHVWRRPCANPSSQFPDGSASSWLPQLEAAAASNSTATFAGAGATAQVLMANLDRQKATFSTVGASNTVGGSTSGFFVPEHARSVPSGPLVNQLAAKELRPGTVAEVSEERSPNPKTPREQLQAEEVPRAAPKAFGKDWASLAAEADALLGECKKPGDEEAEVAQALCQHAGLEQEEAEDDGWGLPPRGWAGEGGSPWLDDAQEAGEMGSLMQGAELHAALASVPEITENPMHLTADMADDFDM